MTTIENGLKKMRTEREVRINEQEKAPKKDKIGAQKRAAAQKRRKSDQKISKEARRMKNKKVCSFWWMRSKDKILPTLGRDGIG